MVFEKVVELIVGQLPVEAADVKMESRLFEDLGADSVDLVELVMAMEEEFEIGEVQEEELGSLKTVGDAVNFVLSKK